MREAPVNPLVDIQERLQGFSGIDSKDMMSYVSARSTLEGHRQ